MNNNANSDAPRLLDYIQWLDRMLGQFAVNNLDENGVPEPLDRLRDVLLYVNVTYEVATETSEAAQQAYFATTDPGSKLQWVKRIIWAYVEDAQELDDTFQQADERLLQEFLEVTEASALSPSAPALSSL